MSFGLNVNNKMNKPPRHQDTKFFPFVPSSLRGKQKNEPPGHQDTKFFPFVPLCLRGEQKMNHEDTRTQSFLLFVPLCLRAFVVNKEVTDGFSSQCR
jgi:hypothetical protein